MRKGLVECLRLDDQRRFVAIYHTFYDVLESTDSVWRHHAHQQPVDEEECLLLSFQQPSRRRSFFAQLSPPSQDDLLDILRLIRTDSQFLFERLQLAGLVSATSEYDSRDAAALDQALGLETTDPISTLLFNVFAASPLDSQAPDARLRLDVWSSVCAKLISHGGYDVLISHILSSWANASDCWKARPRFELYLMDTLQAGAFLLEHVDLDFFGAAPPDPLRTDAAQEFFASAVNALFTQVLDDDDDAGFPHAVMEFACAILGKLRPDARERFLEYLFAQWFFTEFLYDALLYPEVCIYLSIYGSSRLDNILHTDTPCRHSVFSWIFMLVRMQGKSSWVK